MYLFMHLDFIYLPLEFVYLFLYLNLWNSCISQWFFPLFHFRDEVCFSTVGVFHSIFCVFCNLFIIDDNTFFLMKNYTSIISIII